MLKVFDSEPLNGPSCAPAHHPSIFSGRPKIKVLCQGVSTPASVSEKSRLMRVWAAVIVSAFILLISASVFAQPLPFGTEKIFNSDFEDQPSNLNPRIEFSSDQALLFQQLGEQRELAVEVFDVDGDPIPDPVIDWSSGDSSAVTVTPGAPGRAVVTSVGDWSGTVEISASYSPASLTATAEALRAELAAEVVFVETSWVLAILGDRFERHSISLESTPITQGIGTGDIVLSGDLAGIMVRVLAARLDDSTILLDVEPAPITQVFESLSLDSQAEPARVRVLMEKSRTVTTLESLQTGEVLQRAVESAQLLGAVKCGAGLDLGSNVDISFIELVADLDPATRFETNQSRIDLLEIAFSGNLRVSAGLSVKLDAGATLSGSCDVELPAFNLGAIPLAYAIVMSPQIDSSVGVSVSAAAGGQIGWVPLGTFQREWQFNSGLRYSDAAGWSNFKSFQAVPEVPAPDPFSLAGKVALRAEAGLNVDAGLALCLGVCRGMLELLETDFMKFFGGVFWQMDMPTPLNPSSRDYEGPAVTAGAEATGDIGISISPKLLSYLPLQVSFSSFTRIFTEQLVWLENPVILGDISCTPDCLSVPPSDGELTVSVSSSEPTSGTIQLWLGGSGDNTLSILDEFALSDGMASATIALGNLEPGEYQVFQRTEIDGPAWWFTPTWPIASTTPVGSFTVVMDDPPPTATGKLNDTGIDWCADADTINLDCPVAGFEGQDGDFGRDALARAGQLAKVGAGAAGFDFTMLDANGNDLPAGATSWSCVRDNHTGLIWEVKTDDGGLRDKDNTYTWYNPDSSTNGGDSGVQNGGTCVGSSCDTTGFADAVNAQGLCGAGDWRVPSLDELFSIVHHGRDRPAIDAGYFPNSLFSDFWSASPGAGISGAGTSANAWGVNTFGRGFWHAKQNDDRVRLVRGGQ